MAATLTCDSAVIGSGIAGFTAALTLRDKGNEVAVLSESSGATSVSSGAWDLGPIPLQQEPPSLETMVGRSEWRQLYDGFLVDDPELLSLDRVKGALSYLQEKLANILPVQFNFDRAYVLPTAMGHWKPTFGAQSIQAKADLHGLIGKKVGLVGARNWRFRSDLVCSAWKAGASRFGVALDIEPIYLREDLGGADCPLPHVATRLWADETFRNHFFQVLGDSFQVGDWDVLLFPPLFLDVALSERWEADLGMPVAECLTVGEAIAGRRMAKAIGVCLKENGVAVYEVEKLTPAGHTGQIDSLSARWTPSGEWIQVAPKNVVLSTGKYFGGGIHLGFEEIEEKIFKLPLFYKKGTEQVRHRGHLPWADRGFHEAQPWAQVGVKLDSRWRPEDQQGNVVYENLHACGSIIGGVDFAKEGAGLGLMALSGRRCAASI